VAGDVSAAVDHSAHGVYAEIVVAHRAVAGELRGAALDVEAVVFGAEGVVALEQVCLACTSTRTPSFPAPRMWLRRTRLRVPPMGTRRLRLACEARTSETGV
jgi:hypothetical protein